MLKPSYALDAPPPSMHAAPMKWHFSACDLLRSRTVVLVFIDVNRIDMRSWSFPTSHNLVWSRHIDTHNTVLSHHHPRPGFTLALLDLECGSYWVCLNTMSCVTESRLYSSFWRCEGFTSTPGFSGSRVTTTPYISALVETISCRDSGCAKRVKEQSAPGWRAVRNTPTTK